MLYLTEKESEFITEEYKVFYKGVIEDNQDPLQMGRVRVRLLGVHSPSLDEVPISTLPWANVLQSLNFGGYNSGCGISGIPILGTWVLCFLDNNDPNNIVVIGALSGINSTQNANYGFKDPKGIYPKASYINKPDINSRIISNGYLNTYVIETPGNNVIMIDDKNNSIQVLHSSGRYININNNNITLHSASIILDGNTQVNGNVEITGGVHSQQDIVANTVSLQNHTHGGVLNGSGNTAKPNT